MIESRFIRSPLLGALTGILLLVGVLLAAGPEEVLAALPLVLLLGALVFKCYPGERLIERLAERFRPRRPRPESAPVPTDLAELRSPRTLAQLTTVRPLRGPPLPV